MKLHYILAAALYTGLLLYQPTVQASEALLPLFGPEQSSDSMTLPLGKIQINGYANAGGLFNARGSENNMVSYFSKNEFGLDGAYLSLSRAAETNGCGFDWGFGLDFMFGNNYRFMRSIAGLDQDWKTSDDYYYGFAMPQVYAELAYNFWSVKIGHFITPMGYEAYRADGRFFYSLSYAFDKLPGTHTGVMVAYNGFDNADIYFGWVNGDDNGFATNSDESSFLGSICYHFGEWSSLTWSVELGKGGLFGKGTDEFISTLVYSGRFSEHWGYALEYDYGNYSLSNIAASHYNVWGNYLYYTYNDCWRFGGRLEWIWEDGWQTMEMTVGTNWTPYSWLTVRPEIRYDNANYGRFDKGYTPDQLTLGFDVVASF